MISTISKILFFAIAIFLSALSSFDLPLRFFIFGTLICFSSFYGFYRSLLNQELAQSKKISLGIMSLLFPVIFYVGSHVALSMFYGIPGLGGFGCGDRAGRNIFTNSLNDYECKWLPWYVKKVTGNDEKWNVCMKNKGNNIAGCALLSPTPFITASPMNGKAPLEVIFLVNYLRTSPIGTLVLNYDSSDSQIATSTVVTCEEWDVTKSNCLKTNELKHVYSKPGIYPVYYSFVEGPNNKELLGVVHILVTE